MRKLVIALLVFVALVSLTAVVLRGVYAPTLAIRNASGQVVSDVQVVFGAESPEEAAFFGHLLPGEERTQRLKRDGEYRVVSVSLTRNGNIVCIPVDGLITPGEKGELAIGKNSTTFVYSGTAVDAPSFPPSSAPSSRPQGSKSRKEVSDTLFLKHIKACRSCCYGSGLARGRV